MAVRDDFTAGEVLAAADLNDTFSSKLDASSQQVVQIVHASHATRVTSTSSTFADTGLAATITPTSASNDILVLIAQNGISKISATTNVRVALKVLRDATEILNAQTTNWLQTNVPDTDRTHPIFLRDSPATTSAITYKTQFADVNNTGTVRVQDNSDSFIVLMEIQP
jgi:hypothetical protein